MKLFAFCLVLVLLAVPAVSVNAGNWHAAACCSMGERCPANYARKSGKCRTNRWMNAQPNKCRKAACAYCAVYKRRNKRKVCLSRAIHKNCFMGTPPRRPSTRPPSTRRPTTRRPTTRRRTTRRISGGRSSRCVLHGFNNKIFIPATRFETTSQWSRKDNGAIIWRKDGNGPSVTDAKGSGETCVKFKVPSTGTYYLTVISQAPHGTEHNDAWIKLDAGLNMYRHQHNKFKYGDAGYYKGYQNDGHNKMANYFLTIDHDGHQFISKTMNAGRVYTVCLAGRSSKYIIHEVRLVKCTVPSGGSSPHDSCVRTHPYMVNALSSGRKAEC